MAMTGLARLLLVFVLGLLAFRDVTHGEDYLIAVLSDANRGVWAFAGETGGWFHVQGYTRTSITPFTWGITRPIVGTTSGIENRSLSVNVSDDSISLYGVYSRIVFSLLPISALGTKYIVSSCHPPGNYISVLVIAAHSQKTDVEIIFRLEGNITYDGRRYSDGDTLTLNLEEYQTFTIRSVFDITGTLIKTIQTVAVFIGTEYNRKTVTYDQLLPTKHYGQEYVVAVDDNPALYKLQIVTEHNDTWVMFNNGSTVSIGGTRIYRQFLTVNKSLYFSSNRPVMVTLHKENGVFSNFFIIPPVSLYIKQTAFDYHQTVKILTDKDNIGILVRDSSKNIQLEGEWEEIPGSRYKVGTWKRSFAISSNNSFTTLAFHTDTAFNGGYDFWINPPQRVCDREHYGPECIRICTRRHCVGISTCNPSTGQCDGGCKAGWAGIDCTACDFTHYGANCTGECSARHCNGYSSCSPTTGQCEGGCETGWAGIDCTVCDGNHYGPDCNRTCVTRHCKGSSSCNPTTGQCDSGCQAGWSGVDCTECDDYTYGDGCSSLCVERHCRENSSCHHVTGSCDNGCKPGWRGQDCREVCDREHYGRDCSRVCVTRHCVGVSSCNASTGQCDGKCQTGWTGIDCTECDDNTYGINCSFLCDERYCSGNSSCHHVTGSCDNGCKPGWMGKDCRKACGVGHYGPDCIGVCASRHCDETSSCSPITGRCDGECQTGWTGIDCTECDDITYGNNCSLLCTERHCSGISSCDKVTGSCDNGCEAGWKGRDCTEACEKGHYGPDCTGTCDTRHCEGNSTCIPSTGQCDKGCQAEWTGTDCTEVKTSSINYIVVGTVTTGVVILVVVVSIVVWRRRSVRRANNTSDQIHYVHTSPPQFLNKTKGNAGKDNHALKCDDDTAEVVYTDIDDLEHPENPTKCGTDDPARTYERFAPQEHDGQDAYEKIKRNH